MKTYVAGRRRVRAAIGEIPAPIIRFCAEKTTPISVAALPGDGNAWTISISANGNPRVFYRLRHIQSNL